MSACSSDCLLGVLIDWFLGILFDCLRVVVCCGIIWCGAMWCGAVWWHCVLLYFVALRFFTESESKLYNLK